MEQFMTQLEPWFQWLTRSTLQVSILVCIVLLVKIVLRTRLAPRWHYCLWLLVIVRMVMPAAPQSSFSVFNLIPDSKEHTIYAPVVEMPLGEIPVAELPMQVEISQPIPQAVVPAPEERIAFIFPPLVELLPFLWLIGAIVLAIYVFAGNFRLWSIIKLKRPVTDSGVLDLLEDCKAQMNIHTPLVVVETDKVSSPALFGFLRPRLLLPEGMLNALDRAQLRHILLHELAHLKRGDIYLGWVVAILQTIHWFNPLVWFGFGRMRMDRELACDNLALTAMGVEESTEYGRTIVKLLENFSKPKYTPSLAGILEERSQLKRRITMIAKFKKGSYRFSVMAAVLFIVLSVAALTNARTRTPSGSAIVDQMHPNLYQNLVLYYSFDKGNEETVFDMSGKGNDGIVHGAAYTENGVSGKAMAFDGRYSITNDGKWQGQYIDAGDDLSIQAEIFTLAAWIRTNDTERQWQTILSYEDGSHAVSVLNGKVHYGWQGIKLGGKGTTDIRTGRWVFIAVTRDQANKASIYVNGKLENSFICDTSSSFDRRAKIGGDTIDGEFFSGSIDELAIFNRALSWQEIKQLFDKVRVLNEDAQQTYIVEFKAVSPFAPQTFRELLNAFNENHPRNVRTHHYRTEVLGDELLGYICVDRKSGNDAVISMLKRSEKLDFINSTPSTEEDLEKLYAKKQVSLKKATKVRLPSIPRITHQVSNNSGGDPKRIKSMQFNDGTSIRSALKMLGKLFKKNIIPSEKVDVDGKVMVAELYDVTFEETLEAILGSHKYIIDGKFIRVYTAEEFEEINTKRAKTPGIRSTWSTTSTGRTFSARTNAERTETANRRRSTTRGKTAAQIAAKRRRAASRQSSGRQWGPEQATGEPDTHKAGDIVTAWASLSQDGQKEWLVLEYTKGVIPSRIDIYETYNPGAVYKVTVFNADGKEIKAWEGKDPTPKGSGKGVSNIPVAVNFKISKIKIYLDSPKVRGWNEIDAVGLIDNSGKTQWATRASASSTYAEKTQRTNNAARLKGRNRGPEQATSKPDTQASKPLISIEIDTMSDFLPGDSIEITEILGTSGKIEPGQTYTVKGKYTLASRDKAMLNLYATNGETSCEQGPVINKGQGEFTRTFTYKEEGWLHLGLYSYPGDEGNFGNLYFNHKNGYVPDISKIGGMTEKVEQQPDRQTDKPSIGIDITSEFLPGDSIEIVEITGTSGRIEAGHTYTIKGKYQLSSRDEAQIHLISTNGSTSSTPNPIIKRGTGFFTRTLNYIEGNKDTWLQLKFVPADGSESFGNLYFYNKNSYVPKIPLIKSVKSAAAKVDVDESAMVSVVEKIGLTGGDILKIKANRGEGFNFPFYLFIPKTVNKNQKVHLLVEPNNTGTSSDDFEVHREKALRSIRSSYPNKIARDLGSPLLIPTFPRPRSKGQAYTHALDRDTLEITEGKLNRIDLQLTAMIKYAQELLRVNGFKIDDQILMHGFSASAKFANRYSYLHPEMVKAVAVGGVNGLPTLPVSKWNGHELPFPIGLAGIEEFTNKPFNEKAFRKVAHYIYMGAFDRNDTLPSREAWSEEEAEIIKNVLAERMMPDRWELTRKIYKDQNINAQCITYNGVSHSIKSEMLDDVVKFFKANAGEKYNPIEPHQYPFVEFKQIKHAHINGLYWSDDERLAESDRKNPYKRTFLIGIKEWNKGQDHRQLTEFHDNAGFNFVLKAQGQKDIEINEKNFSGTRSWGHGEFQAFYVKLGESQFGEIVDGVSYRLEALNSSDEYFWTVNDGVKLTKSK